MSGTANSQNTTDQKKRNTYFRIISILMPFLFLLLLELVLRIFSYGHNMHLFVRHPEKELKEYFSINPYAGEKYFSRFEATGGVNDLFLKQKPDNGFRIFVLGSSTMVGFPYEKNLMATRILHQRLQDAYPHKEIEMVNTAITAINSITLKDYVKDIVKHEPDALLIYAGHNEYYGAFGVGSNETLSRNSTIQGLHFRLMHLRVYQLLRKAFSGIKNAFSNAVEEGEKGSLMKRIVSDENIVKDGEKYLLGLEQFESNMTSILEAADKKNIPVFLSDLVSNVKDLIPFSSVSSSSNDEATMAYNRAVVNFKAGLFDEAKTEFYNAKDLDPIRFRAPEKMNGILAGLADRFQCYYIPTKKFFMDESQNGLIGNSLLTEHVHPNIDGQFLLAESFFSTIAGSGLIDNEVDKRSLRSPEYYRNTWGYTILDSLSGEYKIRQLKSYWPFAPLSNEISFRDRYIPKNRLDSLAFSTLFTLDARLEELHWQLAEEYFRDGDYTRALPEYKALVNISPYVAKYANQAATCLLRLNDLYNAEKYIDLSLKYRPGYLAHMLNGEIEFLKHQFSLAADQYEKAFSLAEEVREQDAALEKLYLAYYYGKDSEKARKVSGQLERRSIEYSSSPPPLAYTYSSYIPYNIKDHINLAYGCLSRNEADSALLYLYSSLKVNDTPLANRLIGNIMLAQKDNNLLFYYSKALPAFQREPEFLKNYIIGLMVNRETDKAKDAFAMIVDIDPDYKDIPTLRKLVFQE